MKKLSLIILLFTGITASAQVRFKQLSLDEALKEASTTGKLVFAQYVTEQCEACNEVADKAFADVELGKFVEQKCIPIKIEVDSKDRLDFTKRFPTIYTMGTYFILGNGDLIHRFTKTISKPSAYSDEINAAYTKWQEGLITLKELDREWSLSPENVDAMEANLDKRAAVSLPTDSLLEVYVKRLPADSFNSKRVLIFLSNHAPLLGSEADNVLRRNTDLFNMAWYSLKPQQRSAITGRMIGKTMKLAIDKKQESLVHRIAEFQSRLYENRTSETVKRSTDKLFLNYYREVKDYDKYLKLAVPYYDNYIMMYPTNFVLQQDSFRRIALLNTLPGDTTRTEKGFTVRKTLSSPTYTPMASFYNSELNEAAWIVYMASDKDVLLKKGLEWAKRANELFKSAAAMDTYARLLYKSGNAKEAIEWETKAIEVQKERKFSAKRFEKVLENMQSGAKKIDEYSS